MRPRASLAPEVEDAPMQAKSLFSLSDQDIVRDTRALALIERETTVELILHIAEVEHRRLYKPGHAYMAHWCMAELGMSESAAYKRVHAGRAARRYPTVLSALLGGIGVLLVLLSKTQYVVRIIAAGGESDALFSYNLNYLRGVVGALNEAIVHRG